MRVLDWNEYVLADENCPQVDTEWAQSCFLILIQECQTTRAFIGHIVAGFHEDADAAFYKRLGLLSDDRDPAELLRRMLTQAKTEFSKIKRLIVRGGSNCFPKPDEGEASPAEIIEMQQQQRRLFLNVISEAELQVEEVDIHFGEDDTQIQIIYDAQTGDVMEESQKYIPA